MKLLFLSLLALLGAVLLAGLAGRDNGLVVMSIAGWRLQTSAGFFVIALLLGFGLLYFSIRAVARCLRLPRDLREGRLRRRQQRAEKYLTEGLIHMTEGRWRPAERDFYRAARVSRAPYVNYLYAARAAQEAGAVARRDDYLRLAFKNRPEAGMAIGLTQARLQLSQRQTEQALATLKDLQRQQPGQPQVRQLLLQTYTDLKDWRAVLALLPAIGKTGLYSPEQMQARQLEAHAALLKEAGAAADRARLDRVWAGIAGKLKQHPYLTEVYVAERLRFADTADCEQLLRRAIKRRWDAALVRLYGLVEAPDAARQLATAEALLQARARDAALLLTLGRLCKRNRLWGKAGAYLQESIEAQPNPEAYYELARLHEHNGAPEQAAGCYEQGLKLATGLR